MPGNIFIFIGIRYTTALIGRLISVDRRQTENFCLWAGIAKALNNAFISSYKGLLIVHARFAQFRTPVPVVRTMPKYDQIRLFMDAFFVLQKMDEVVRRGSR